MSAAEWAIPYVEYAATLNIVNGYGNGKFGPNDTVTYEQAVTMIVRALGYTDECKEMNGSWPAIYVQKATALGLFDDVVNGGATGADRGDVAIMLYNALDCAEVYADGDGKTCAKSGKNSTLYNGDIISGVTMLGVLNRDGDDDYGIVSSSDADNALINIRSYVGAAGKIYTNKDGDVLAIGDIKTQFLTGTVNGDGDELTVDGTVYTIDDNALSTIDEYGTISNKENTVDIFTNGLSSGDNKYTKTKNGVLDGVDKNKSITVAAKVSGKTITNIFSVLEWSKSKTAVVSESDLATISSKQTLLGYDFKTDDNGDIDYTTFTLTGVDSLDDIAEDNVVYVYADKNDKIRKVEVGTETVTGVIKSFSQGTKKSTGDAGTQATFNIDGTSYKGTNAEPADSTVLEDWTLATSSKLSADNSVDSVKIGDTVIAYLDSTGKIYKFELSETASSDYVMVLESSIATTADGNKIDGGEVKYTTTNLGTSDIPQLYVYTAKGEALTLDFAKNASVKDSKGKTYTGDDIPAGSVITYSLNSSGKIKSVTVKASAKYSNVDEKLTAKGYIDGAKVLDSAVIFTVKNDASNALDKSYDDDDADIATLSSLLDTDEIHVYATVTNSKGQIEALVIDSEVTTDDVYYGVVTGITSIDSDDNNDNDSEATILVNGEEKTYQYDSEDAKLEKNVFYAFQLDASGYIDIVSTVASDSANNSYLGYAVATASGITVSSNVVKNVNDNPKPANTTVTLDSNVIYVVESGSSYAVGTKSDLTGADEGDYALFFDLDDEDDRDGVADLVIITSKPDKADTGTNAYRLTGGEIPEKIDSVNVSDYVAPVTGVAPVSTVTAANVKTGTVEWTGELDGVNFKASTEYTAKITLAVEDGYVFDSSIAVANVTVTNGEVASVEVSKDAKTLTITLSSTTTKA
jgi:hypothetical protein